MKRLKTVLSGWVYRLARLFFSGRTIYLIKLDLRRTWTRMRRLPITRQIPNNTNKLHLGCGSRLVSGWLNVDVSGSDFDLDITMEKLPWPENTFSVIVSQHVVEHLVLVEELIPLLREIHRVAAPAGEIWLSCPDVAKICKSYSLHKMEDLLTYRREVNSRAILGQTPYARYEDILRPELKEIRDAVPTVYLINDFFHQFGQHKNLYDAELLIWALEKAGFGDVRRVTEEDLLLRYPEFPARNDEPEALHVVATKKPAAR